MALIAYGAAGSALLVAAAVAVGPSVTTIEALARSSADVRQTLEATRDGFDGFGTSLEHAVASAERAAASARSSADAAEQLANGMSVSILGAQPLLSLANGFRRQSADLDALAVELDGLARALGRNERDVNTIRDGIGALHARTSDLAASPLVAGATWVGPLFYGLIAWLAVPAVAALWAGLALWRNAAR